MSSQPAPVLDLPIFNSANYNNLPNEGSSDQANFPTLQGTLTAPNGIIWGDGTFQNTASGGGGSGVQNPMTSDLDGGGFSITNVDTFAGMDLTITGLASIAELETEQINDSAAVIYRNKGAVVAGNYYNVGEGLVMTDAEASCIVVSRCLDPGFKQTMVIHVSMFNAKAHLNLISNALESDTPIFTLVSAGDDGLGSGGFSFYCNQNSATWEYRVYRQQDNKGTGTYPANSYFNFALGGAVATSAWVVSYAELDTSVHASAAVSGSFLAKTSLTSATLQTDTATATVSLSTARVNTDELNNNGGTGLVSVISPIGMNNNDIQSAGIIGAAGYYISAPGVLPIGSPGGPLYLDTVNNRVGINVPVPTEDLEIDGNIQLDSGAGANSIKFYDTAGAHDHAWLTALGVGTNGGQYEIKVKEDGGILNTRFTIFEDGRISVTNRIENVSNPVNPQDAATKDYVDSSVPTGFVTNPMTSDLDGGQFNITNIDLLNVETATGSVVEMDANAYTVKVKDSAAADQLLIRSNVGSTTHSGNTIYQLGGLNIQPKLTASFPRAGNNIIMGQYAWSDSGGDPSNIGLSRANSAAYYGGGGNIYCNTIRQNIWYNQATSAASYISPYTAGFQGNSVVKQYYNGADIGNALLNTGNAGGEFQEFQLPEITEAMVGTTFKVSRLRLNEIYYPGINAAGIARYKAAVVVTPKVPDLIAGPDSLFLSGGGFAAGAMAIDPYRVITTPPPPAPYRGVDSLTFIACQCGDGQNVNSPTTQYVWQCINEFPSQEPLTAYENWYLPANLTGGFALDINTWDRQIPNPDGCQAQTLTGTGMVMSGTGEFTFPCYGKWRVTLKCIFRTDMNVSGVKFARIVTTRNAFLTEDVTTYVQLGRISNGGAVPDNIYLTSTASVILDIVDTAQDKVKIFAQMQGGGDFLDGGLGATTLEFERVADV